MRSPIHSTLSALPIVLAALIGAPALAQPARKASKKAERPIIGINMDVSQRGDSGASPALRLSGAYVDAITSAGGIPVVLPPVLDKAAIRRQVALCDGFLFVGGADINPERYGETSHPAVNLLNPRREEYDFALMEAVLKTRKPMLGVCLGCQEFNVAMGGSLIQDLPTETTSTIDHRPYAPRGEFVHEIEIEPGTKLADLLGTTTLGVNSIHHQACEVPGAKLRVAARAPDGTIEAIELPGKRFALGVQWHPEALTHHPEHLRVYKGLVDTARRTRDQAASGKTDAGRKAPKKKQDKADKTD